MTTNRERINTMSNEEMAKFISNLTNCEECFLNELCCKYDSCKETFYEWLNQESER